MTVEEIRETAVEARKFGLNTAFAVILATAEICARLELFAPAKKKKEEE